MKTNPKIKLPLKTKAPILDIFQANNLDAFAWSPFGLLGSRQSNIKHHLYIEPITKPMCMPGAVVGGP
jgi:hypothetical protein